MYIKTFIVIVLKLSPIIWNNSPLSDFFFMGVFQESVNSFQTNGMKEMHVINEVVYTNLSTSPKYAADQQEPLFSD